MKNVTTETREKRRPGRKRIWQNETERQRAIRQRRDTRNAMLEVFRSELRELFCRGRCPKLLEHGPEEPQKWFEWAIQRMRDARAVIFPATPGEGKRLSTAATAVLTALLAGEAVTVDEGRVTVGGKPVQAQVWRMLVSRGYVADGRLTDAGREALRKAQ